MADKVPPTWPIFALPLNVANGQRLQIVKRCSSPSGGVVDAALLGGLMGILVNGHVCRVGQGCERLPFNMVGKVEGEFVKVSW